MVSRTIVVLLGGAGLLASLGDAGDARACARCDCVAPPSVTAAMGTSAVVFIGTARDAGATAPLDSIPEGADEPRAVTAFALEYLWKGDSLTPPRGATTLYVWSRLGDCDLQFTRGELYLVYAVRDANGRLSATRCSRTRPLSDPQAHHDVRELYRVTRPPIDVRSRRAS
jgi:hypothetical protein